MNLHKGISIILCCYNSSRLLPETLKALSLLSLPEGHPVELVIINNASTDDTGKMALREWKRNNTPYPMHLYQEEKPGLIFARKKGLKESRYPFILFVDDDNRPDKNYLVEMAVIFERYPDVAALGGENEAIFESEKPPWFQKFEHSYAVGKPVENFGEPPEIGLFGAGLCIRREAYDLLIEKGFESRLVGRTGKSLSSGEDYELCKALKIAGWDVFFSPKLKLKHYITTSRLNWEYLRKLNRGISRSIIWFLAYEYWIAKLKYPQKATTDLRFSWIYLLLKKTLKKAWLKTMIMLRPKFRQEGSAEIIEYERTATVVNDLLVQRKDFIKFKHQIGEARWNILNKEK